MPITKMQEIIYRCRHHHFAGLSVRTTALIMDISPRQVQRALAQMKETVPHLFPILTKRQAEIYGMITIDNLTHQEIADKLNISLQTVRNEITTLHKKNGITLSGMGNVKSYHPLMDGKVKEKF